jgi:hypothetical protein
MAGRAKILGSSLQPVTARSSSALAVIVDDDLGFVMWLGEIFAELECKAMPALNCRQALALAKRWALPITAVVLNPDLPGAARMVKTLLAANPEVHVVLIRDSTLSGRVPPDPKGIQAQSILARPSPGEPISRAEWLAKVRESLFLPPRKMT